MPIADSPEGAPELISQVRTDRSVCFTLGHERVVSWRYLLVYLGASQRLAPRGG
jgi:hypothetical protein